MKKAFLPRLALRGIRKNRRLYLPYLLTWILMVGMFYIISYLSQPEVLEAMGRNGGGSTAMVLTLGSFVIGIFAVIFLFYTNSFLLRQRKKEFGLYNILGMDKRGISRIYAWETQFVAVVALVLGVVAGVALSKLSELALTHMVSGTVRVRFTVSWIALRNTLLLFAGIFVLILVSGLISLRRLAPMELLRSESFGEKPPKANWLLGILGILLLGGAYYIAVAIRNPIATLLYFFAAVLLVIGGSYLIFIAGSVLLCRILQKNKRYYYRKNHFVSVSSMAYRMKRNGAGLASICILLTMVLVMISSTACLYFGAEDSLRGQNPRDISLRVEAMDDYRPIAPERLDEYRAVIDACIEKSGAEITDLWDCCDLTISGLLEDGVLTAEVDTERADYDKLVNVSFLDVQDYIRLTGEQVSVQEGQALAWRTGRGELPESLTVGTLTFRLQACTSLSTGLQDMIFPTVYLVVENLNDTATQIWQSSEVYDHFSYVTWHYDFNTNLPAEEELALLDEAGSALSNTPAYGAPRGIGFSGLEAQREDFYGTFGGLFFLGILLSVVFLVAAVLIIYYKQISEGYEDRSRFDIMQRVGMTRKDIRKSINSQMLTVFFLPIGMAVLHLGFAFPMIRKLLLLFGLNNLALLLTTTAVSVLLFAAFYAIVYRITSNAYFSIVSGARELSDGQ